VLKRLSERIYDHPEAVRSVFRNIIIFDIASVK
jgi:hypothetical protein